MFVRDYSELKYYSILKAFNITFYPNLVPWCKLAWLVALNAVDTVDCGFYSYTEQMLVYVAQSFLSVSGCNLAIMCVDLDTSV